MTKPYVYDDIDDDNAQGNVNINLPNYGFSLIWNSTSQVWTWTREGAETRAAKALKQRQDVSLAQYRRTILWTPVHKVINTKW